MWVSLIKLIKNKNNFLCLFKLLLIKSMFLLFLKSKFYLLMKNQFFLKNALKKTFCNFEQTNLISYFYS